jgi:hypothetical protein
MNEIPVSAIGTLKLMPSNTQQIARFSKLLIEDVQNGNVNPLELLVMLRALEGMSKTVRECIDSNIQSAADKYSEKEFEVLGAKIQKGDVGVEYDYKNTGDHDWERFATDEATAAARRKERETFLRSLKEPMDVLDKDSGEMWTIRPPLRRSKPGLKVFFK